jgi:hypothetical protein
MYDDNERGAAEAVSETISVLCTTTSFWFLVVRRDTNVMVSGGEYVFEASLGA